MRVIFLANLVSILLGAQVGNLGGHIQRDRDRDRDRQRYTHQTNKLTALQEASDEVSR